MRRILGAALLALAVTAVGAAEDQKRVFRFSKADLGKVPAGWKVEKTGKGEGSVWKVVADDTAPSKAGVALAQTAQSPSAVFNLCVAEDTSYTDVEVMVAFKAVRGDTDQGGGIVWRYQDANNYYIARMNPLESNFRVYKVVEGKRIQLESKGELKVATGVWHQLKIKMVGDRIECFLDGNKHLDVTDGTFKQAGKIGLWTKADAQTHFDEVRISPPRR
jgi:hypothetical protein